MEKLCSLKIKGRMAGKGMHPPHLPLDLPPVVTFISKTQCIL